MTTSQLDQLLLDILGETSTSFTYAEEIRYRYLDRARKHVQNQSWLTYRGGVQITTATDDESFDLSSSSIITLTTGAAILDVKKVVYHVSSQARAPLLLVNLADILALRSESAGTGNYPTYYTFHWKMVSGTSKPYLEIYPAISNNNDVLRLDILENLRDITSSNNPQWATYADECIALWAAYFILQSVGDQKRFDLHNIAHTGTADVALREARYKSYAASSGQERFGWLKS